MPGSAAIMKRCRDDESLKAQDSVIEAASALAVLSQSPTSTRHASSGSDQSESSDTETDDATVKTNASSAATASSTREKITVPFPQKLMEMLNTLESESSDGSLGDQPIFWLPGGDGFIISDPNEFTLKILPRFFYQRVEFSSFTRKLYWWGFRKVVKGSGAEAFRHDCFLKADPSLCRKMKGKPRRKPTSSLIKQAIAKSKSPNNIYNNSFTSSALPIHKNIAFGTAASPAANLLLNNSSPLIAAAALRLQEQQQQQDAHAATTQAAIQQLVLNHASVTNQALALAAANAQQQQRFIQPAQQVNIAAYLASLQRGDVVALQHSGVIASPAQQLSLAAQQLQGTVAAPAPAPPIQLPVAAAAAVAPTASSAPATDPVPGSQVVIHVHHMPDGSVTFTQGNGPNANSA